MVQLSRIEKMAKFQHSKQQYQPIVPLIFLEVVPIILTTTTTKKSTSPSSVGSDDFDDDFPPSITNFGVKEYLLRLSQQTVTQYICSDLISSDKQQKQGERDTDIDDKQQEYGIWIQWNNSKNKIPTKDKVSNVYNHHNAMVSGYLLPKKRIDNIETYQSNDEEPTYPLFYVPSEDPTVLDPIPCCITAYTFQYYLSDVKDSEEQQPYQYFSRVHVSESTLIRILPPKLGISSLEVKSQPPTIPVSYRRSNFLHNLLGEKGDDSLSESLQQEVLQNHNPETIDELSLKMSMILSEYIQIGTSPTAFQSQQKQIRQMTRMTKSIRSFSEIHNLKSNKSGSQDNLATTKKHISNWWPSLIVHSPNHADGKTLLVQTTAKKLGCNNIHIIRFGVLLAKYGSQADAALESQLHAILLSAACSNESVCIILDHLDTMMPPRLSGRSAAGDAALPVFNAVASYLRNITASMQRLREFPFPVKNGLYNSPSLDSLGGSYVVPVKGCIVGILTCPDDGWKFSLKNDAASGGGFTIFDSMICDRYRLPLLTAHTRLSAITAAFEKEGISLDPLATTQLPVIAASSAWAKGDVFHKVAKQLKHMLLVDNTQNASLQQVEKSFALVKKDTSEFTKVSFEVQNETPGR